MGNTTEMQFERDISQAHVGVHQQFLHPFNSLLNNIFFNGNSLYFRKSRADLGISKINFLADIFFLPVQGLGKWLSNKWRRYNAIAAFFNALIDMPFSAFVEFLEGWRYFIKERKEEIR